MPALGVLALAVAVSGCGVRGSTDRTARCVPTPVSGASGSRLVLMPAAPVITRAWRDAQHIYVDLLVPPVSTDCTAVALLVGASSKADGANQALAMPGTGNGRGDGRERDYRPGPLHVVLRRPILDLPPYIAYASARGARGERSPIARYPIPEKGDYCLRHRSAEQCVREAQALAKRCTRGQAPRAQCADWAYASRRPYPATPIKGASVTAVRENLSAVLNRQLANGVRLAELTCTRGLVCIATFRRSSYEGRMRVRYVLGGYHKEPGCWFATTIDVLERPDGPPSMLEGGAPIHNQSSCLSRQGP